ncbi:isopenicillin N synthase family dioxygenase [Streptomyces zagrosensis]|uniref:Isopenicillin N synthase-like dioxygenase n=1 Tax=Streptomyces zagrosensis TaxID=1042984 RepID=A0A7W9QEI1_9ACTN|nr:isopenicillin N synthase family oxygenase [Streptomyces zagrosensis]MBB5938780.1 isopenicillin N synthase-like dioxygenase [Streptomyces zagrosensis]
MTTTPRERRPVTVLDGYVPVIDLSMARQEGSRAAVAQAIGHACENSGFFTVVGHGVGQDLIDRVYALTKEFFELPSKEKAKTVSGPGTGGLRYSAGSAGKSMGLDTPPDLCEIFTSNVLGDRGADRQAMTGDASAPWSRTNVWPSTPQAFEETWIAYGQAMERLGAELMGLFALALGLDAHFFDDKIDKHISTIVANYYYPQLTPPLPGQMRKGPHTDWGNLTILYQDEIGGLQVRQEGQGWRDVPYLPGSFVINIGDMMAFWTGGHWVSTLHRVLNPVAGHTGSRLSLPFFYLPNHDAVIEPLPRFSGAEAAQGRTSATTPGHWYREKMAATYS